jgi:2-oxoglutarate ferredoxin oxidoreductase subunit beta
MEKIVSRSPSILEKVSGYCPGCLHGVAHRIVAETIDEMGIQQDVVGVMPVGCSSLSINYWNIDTIHSAHGRAPAVATGAKRCAPERIVFTYQGDGDLAAIGMAEILHAANRGENFTTIFINNSIYGMTGGQMAPTTLVNMKSTTSPKGRNPKVEGYPMKMCEILSQLDAPYYIARFILNTPQNILKAKAGIYKAFSFQKEEKGFCFIELLSNCPTNWGLSPLASLDWMVENTLPVFPLGIFKDGGIRV